MVLEYSKIEPDHLNAYTEGVSVANREEDVCCEISVPQDPGLIFRLSPSGALTSIYQFERSRAEPSPLSGIMQATDGNFYGTTVEGGDTDLGTIFKLTPAGNYTQLHQFQIQEGSTPIARLTQLHQGSIFRLSL